MVKIKLSAVFSPLGIFFIYMIVSGLAIMGFRFIFPSAPIPLYYFSTPWRLTRGFLDYFALFPALTLTSLVIPFGFIVHKHDRTHSFSPEFFRSLKMSIVTVIVASSIYGLLYFLALPLAQNYEAKLLSQSRLYLLAKGRVQENFAKEEWNDVLQFVAICDSIWPEGPELTKYRVEAEIRSQEHRLAYGSQDTYTNTQTDSPEKEPVDVTEALIMAETALDEERYFDAHWLATLAGHLAVPGSVEVAMATRLAGRAWSGVNSLAPNAAETQIHTNYRLKREGYEALVGQEFIRSYYIFLELLALTPGDPDVDKYFAKSEEGVKQAAFFIDEVELTLGKIMTGAVFSLPTQTGRMAMKISSLSTSPDTAYGIETEIAAFDRDGRQLWSMEAPFVKISSLNLDTGPSIVILLRALDRTDKTKYWEPTITSLGQDAPHGVQIVLPVSWENFLLLSNVRLGLSTLSSVDLKTADDNLGNCGYLPLVFEAELLARFVRPLFLLPLGIFTLAMGWQYRALKRPRYMAVPMLGILPLVFNGAVYFSRSCLNVLEIWAVSSLGFTTAAVFFGIGLAIMLVAALILLASKHG